MAKWVEIGACVLPIRNWNPARDSNGNFFTYIDIGSIRQADKIIEAKSPIPAKQAPSRARQLVAAGDVLVSTVRPNLNAVAQVQPALDGATASTGFCVLRPDNKTLISEYLFHRVRSPQFISEMIKQATGASYPAVSDGIVLASRLPLPAVDEQRRIAAILDKAEELRAKRRMMIDAFSKLTHSIFVHMFGDPTTNPKNWPYVPFGKLGENQDSQRIPVKASDRDDRKGEYPYYGASGIIDWVDQYIFEGERLLIGEDGANLIARATPVAFIAQGKYWVNNHAHVIAENGGADLRFLEHFIEYLDLKPFISGTAQPKLNRSSLDRIFVPVPPLRAQREFARRVSAMEKLTATQRTSLGAMDALFASLQYRAFRGEL